jgi:hypothetical protein
MTHLVMILDRVTLVVFSVSAVAAVVFYRTLRRLAS